MAKGFFAAVVVLVVVYMCWDESVSRSQKYERLSFCLALIPPLAGVLGIILIWTAYHSEWQSVMSYRGTVIWTAILAMAVVLSLFADLAIFFINRERLGDQQYPSIQRL